MKFTLRGAANYLRGIADTMGRLSEVPRKTAIIAAPKLTDLLFLQFLNGTNPYGRPWAPLAKATLAKGRFPPPLTDTKDLRDGTKVIPYPGGRKGLMMIAGAFYGRFHQTGFHVNRRPVPARKIFPEQGFPREWSRVLKESFRQAVAETVGGRPPR